MPEVCDQPTDYTEVVPSYNIHGMSEGNQGAVELHFPEQTLVPAQSDFCGAL
jgi:hypothetical protein